MAKTHDPSIPFSLSIFIVNVIPGFLSLAGATKHGGFSVELIPRDSAKSPLYTESSSHFQKLQNSFLRSIKRAKHFYANSKTKPEPDIPKSQVTPITGSYIMINLKSCCCVSASE
ncbi:hypothetical protein K1719_009100 [Acacia pycnantha]|nr:hypothetical protein K1719_009100 [Acacia pycnantha]